MSYFSDVKVAMTTKDFEDMHEYIKNASFSEQMKFNLNKAFLFDQSNEKNRTICRDGVWYTILEFDHVKWSISNPVIEFLYSYFSKIDNRFEVMIVTLNDVEHTSNFDTPIFSARTIIEF